jgi:predicted O-methyltransferase YrrM
MPSGDFGADRARFAEFLKTIDRYAGALHAIGENRPPEPRWNQVWFPRLDACAAYVMVREARPARIVEIGAGHSTRFMARAIRDGGLDTRLTTIDPEPRASLTGLAIEWITARVQDSSLPALTAGDILFIDSSHVHGPGSDVDYLIQVVLPALPVGAAVHFHDIFLPDPYPREWADRRYSEQDAVVRLLDNGAYETQFASRYVATRMADNLAHSTVADLPLMAGAFENSLWLRKVQPA